MKLTVKLFCLMTISAVMTAFFHDVGVWMSIWFVHALIIDHINDLAKRKQIGGDKCTIMVEVDTTQARAELASLQKQVDELAAAIRDAKGAL